MENQTIYDAVTAHYSAQANSAAQAGAYGTSVAKSFGYTEEELATIPKESNLGLSCGNPLAIASLKEVKLSSFAYNLTFLARNQKRSKWATWVCGKQKNKRI